MRHNEPTTTTRPTRQERARQQVTSLTLELTSLYARFHQFSAGERGAIIDHILSLRAALADASDEYRRARCGAPPRVRPYAERGTRRTGPKLTTQRRAS
jgi:hypothetical protein